MRSPCPVHTSCLVQGAAEEQLGGGGSNPPADNRLVGHPALIPRRVPDHSALGSADARHARGNRPEWPAENRVRLGVPAFELAHAAVDPDKQHLALFFLHLADHIHDAPVWIVPCMQGANPTRTAGSSIYPAVQNMLLAARALGLGATLTTLYLSFEKEVETVLGLPADVHSYALIPIGCPMGRFGPVRRVPLADVTYGDRWGQPYRDA